MKIGFIGYGNMARSLASRWAARHDVLIGGRSTEKAKLLAQAIGARYGTEAEAAKHGEVVVLATPHDVVFEAMEAAGGAAALAGKVLIDINNPVADFSGRNFLTKSYDGGSLAEAIAARAPGGHVVKAFNMCQAAVWLMDPPVFDGRRLAVLHCGDDAQANARVADLIRDLGADPVDMGELKYARLLEAAAAIVIKFLMSGRDVHTVLNLIQPEVKPIG